MTDPPPKKGDTPRPASSGAHADDQNIPPNDTTSIYIVTLRPEPSGPDRFGREPIIRLRLLLKIALRGCGLRAVDVREGKP